MWSHSCIRTGFAMNAREPSGFDLSGEGVERLEVRRRDRMAEGREFRSGEESEG